MADPARDGCWLPAGWPQSTRFVAFLGGGLNFGVHHEKKLLGLGDEPGTIQLWGTQTCPSLWGRNGASRSPGGSPPSTRGAPRVLGPIWGSPALKGVDGGGGEEGGTSLLCAATPWERVKVMGPEPSLRCLALGWGLKGGVPAGGGHQRSPNPQGWHLQPSSCRNPKMGPRPAGPHHFGMEKPPQDHSQPPSPAPGAHTAHPKPHRRGLLLPGPPQPHRCAAPTGSPMTTEISPSQGDPSRIRGNK